MNPRHLGQGGPHRATIHDKYIMLANNLSDVAPVMVKDRLEYALGVILQQYSIGAGLKKFGK